MTRVGAPLSQSVDYGENWLVEWAVSDELRHWFVKDAGSRPLEADEVYVIRVFASGQQQVVIEREMNVLTLAEAMKHENEVKEAIYDELKRWTDLKGFVRYPRSQAKNIIDSRWVLKWKLVDNKRVIKARLTARGFKDAQAQEVKTFAGTATRWGQRIVNIVPEMTAISLASSRIV